ncbi:unnamed protein product [Clonostachys rosea f. rosea IK726]|uniref:Uncharacterized protein n=1 Tax=Clonostachys rosea f. rosea IK726 TaxID=1349383 RepID=A0ACA9U6Y2_BIOOC|nr:unnamed protein product [Clonostachys rosea f. rosea IK726]
MYPDWPRSEADLVPLPRCDGPKLEPFDFKGPQQIEFLEYLGDGLHSQVLKVKILGQIYALKLFRFCWDEDWLGRGSDNEENDLEANTAFYNYSEPFTSECRAFGRLREAGCEELAVKCFGYVLLDEEHERAMLSQFSNVELNGSACCPGADDMRSRFLGRDGRPPPIRGIVKEFGPAMENMRNLDMRRILRDMVGLQQLGIVHIDVADRQIIGGKISDFSTAMTVPHYLLTPELNPHLTPEWISAMEYEAFQFSLNDFMAFDEMARIWNDEHPEQKTKISFRALPSSYVYCEGYNLRSTPSREAVYSLVDPRLYDWKASTVGEKTRSTKGNVGTKKSGSGKHSQGVSKSRRRLQAKPPRWYYDCSQKTAADLKSIHNFTTSIEWVFRDGHIFPQKKK